MNTRFTTRNLTAWLLYGLFSTAVAVPALAQDASLLWKIEGENLAGTSWLYGTHHLMCGEDFLVPDEAVESLQASDALALEIDMSDSAVQQQMMQLAQLPEGKNIADYIDSEEARETVDDFLSSHFGAGLDHFGNMQPILLATMAITAIAECEQALQSHDLHLMQKAMAQGINIKALETVEFQFGLFDDIPLDQQVEELVSVILDPEAGREEFRHMSRLYVDQDIEGIYQLINDDEFWQEYGDVLLDKRNQAWIPVMEEKSGAGSVFYAVGAGHLSGEKGVINLLREAGYTVTPVTTTGQ
ncbi:TraB/GumN family protein [Wenzhouxiangella sp. AB-CW3]|uniref:TraB/GumN family protein n=1 Tax=Wenzhouxiangella sp. AB-CW3 TaxID=2771012 RepID=UPI00168B7787|nr:TraB/GumN family protein [Wenzhouxiangella sp. AB-CW3]QOC23223.1 TraB/GumN family protein [Wenzhouxiangella sp. AB-CW3]